MIQKNSLKILLSQNLKRKNHQSQNQVRVKVKVKSLKINIRNKNQALKAVPQVVARVKVVTVAKIKRALINQSKVKRICKDNKNQK